MVIIYEVFANWWVITTCLVLLLHVWFDAYMVCFQKTLPANKMNSVSVRALRYIAIYFQLVIHFLQYISRKTFYNQGWISQSIRDWFDPNTIEGGNWFLSKSYIYFLIRLLCITTELHNVKEENISFVQIIVQFHCRTEINCPSQPWKKKRKYFKIAVLNLNQKRGHELSPQFMKQSINCI